MKKMLIIEDDYLSQDLMKRVFRTDFEISICESANEYEKKNSSKIFDIIIMDVLLKGIKNGLELIKEIKSVSSKESTQIICLTAHAQEEIHQSAIEAGAGLFITKPVNNKILKGAVDSLVNKRKQVLE